MDLDVPTYILFLNLFGQLNRKQNDDCAIML